ncbi:MAG TPA: MBL fold metallo-hydrolase [Candidatus Thermoplasmatota archaeon]|nr:MBL fold metallo-hydrolase [Candidatus Thermoplasmatota archaeon]
MRLTVLGNPSRYLAPYAPGTGYLVEAGGATLLLDCGQGVLAPLGALNPQRLDAVVISHFHFDHCLDLPVVLHAVRKLNPHLVVPWASHESLDHLGKAYRFQGSFDAPGPIQQVRPGDVLQYGECTVRVGAITHSAPGIALRIEAEGKSLVYCSDSAHSPDLAAFAKGADHCIVHTLIPEVEPDSEHSRIHMTAAAAGRFAAEAQVRHLLLGHRYWESRDEEMLGKTRAAYGGPVTLLKQGDVLPL